jgi:hypothetical protein
MDVFRTLQPDSSVSDFPHPRDAHLGGKVSFC